MHQVVDDVWQPVVYCRERWLMEKVPLALLLCAAGLALVLFTEPRPAGTSVLLATLMVLAVFTLAVTASVLVQQTAEARSPVMRGLAVGVIVIILVGVYLQSPGDLLAYRRTPRHVPIGIVGWVLVVIGMAGIAYAVFRRWAPEPPALALTPDGLSCRLASVYVFIPWREVVSAGPLELVGEHGTSRFEELTAVVMHKDFYEAHVYVDSAFKRGPAWKEIFRTKGPDMQMLIHHEWFGVSPADIREPLMARWKAFGSANTLPPPALDRQPPSPRVYGAWSFGGSLWQTMKFAIPVLAVVGLLLLALLR
ncbi:MAG: hypothetical protein R3D44_13560 [Hyphomicrobiaceae bacterium]